MALNIKLKERLSSFTGIFTGFLSFLGGYQVCHNVCIGIITLLSLIGITITGMPLLFLQKIAIPFWIAAFVLLIITLILYYKKKCISGSLIIINSGLIIAGVPFSNLQQYNLIFWIIGGIVLLIGIISIIIRKLRR